MRKISEVTLKFLQGAHDCTPQECHIASYACTHAYFCQRASINCILGHPWLERAHPQVNGGDTPDAPARNMRSFKWRDTPSVLRQCMLQAPDGCWSHHSMGFTCLHSVTGVPYCLMHAADNALTACSTALDYHLIYHATIYRDYVSMKSTGPRSAGAKLTEVVLPAVLQPLQDPEGLLTRAQNLSVDLTGMLAFQMALFEAPSLH